MRSGVMAGALAAVLGGLLLAAGPASADERVCRGAIGAVTVDDLKVPDGARCVLTRTRVEGNIKVEEGARLIARRVRVDGNVQTQGHRSVLLVRGRVDGDVQLEQGRAATVRRVVIDGNLQSFENRGTQIFQRNRIEGNLQCKSNRWIPRGGGNVVGGDKEDQCARL